MLWKTHKNTFLILLPSWGRLRRQHGCRAPARAVRTLTAVTTGDCPLLYACKNYLVASYKLKP